LAKVSLFVLGYCRTCIFCMPFIYWPWFHHNNNESWIFINSYICKTTQH